MSFFREMQLETKENWNIKDKDSNYSKFEHNCWLMRKDGCYCQYIKSSNDNIGVVCMKSLGNKRKGSSC